MIKKIILFTSLFLSAATFADNTNLYQVNLIVFTHTTQQALQSEKWKNKLLQPYLRNTVELIANSTDDNLENQDAITPDSITPISYQPLPEDQLGLQKEAAKLQNQPGYQIILHTSWIQPINNFRQEKWLHIYGGQTYDAAGQPIANNQTADNQITNNQTADNQTVTDDNTPATPDIQPAYWQLNGKIKLSKDRYFDIRSNLYLTLPETIFGINPDTQQIGLFQPIPLMTFTLNEHRRTRINQINYLDHPLFGALIQITKIDQKT
jgi:hypothetical protein